MISKEPPFVFIPSTLFLLLLFQCFLNESLRFTTRVQLNPIGLMNSKTMQTAEDVGPAEGRDHHFKYMVRNRLYDRNKGKEQEARTAYGRRH